MGVGKGLAVAAAGVGLAAVGQEVRRRRNPYEPRDRVVLITGGSRGLGLALAEELAQQGARLVICARDPGPLELARERLERLGADVLAVPCDVSRREQVEALVARAIERFGHIDVLINNAGIITVGPLEAQILDDFQEAMDIMFWGVVYPTLAVLPGMRQHGDGRIVNVTSIGGKVAVPHLTSYCCAKFAATAFSEGLRAELAKEGIGVITVIPGLMRTGSYRAAFYKGQHKLEYALFAPFSNLPVTSISAERAARQIVQALRRNDAELTITWQAQLLARFHGLAPGLGSDLWGLVNRVLPGADGPTDKQSGYESESAVTQSFLTALGQRAAEEYQWNAK